MIATPDQNLPDALHHIELPDKEVWLLGAAHVSAQSVLDVRSSVEALKPDAICVELCEARHRAMVQGDAWKQTNIVRVVKEGKSLFLIAQLIMSSFYRKIGKQLDVQPGAEMSEGVSLAEDTGAALVLADRNVEITLKRVWRGLSLWSKLKTASLLLANVFFTPEVDKEDIEALKHKDQLENALEALADTFPGVRERLIDERDAYLAQKIRTAPGKRVFAVVGAGHVPGIERLIHEDRSLAPLEIIPPGSRLTPFIKWAIPLAIVALIIAGFVKGGADLSLEFVYIWILVNGTLAALGTAIALAHPLTILSAFLAAPLTSLNPMLAAGWVAGLVQAKMRQPMVADFEDLPNAIVSVRGFWANPVTKILLVVVFANLGSTLGTFISGGWIASRIL
jgi:pheromone shutdown-related protein TraB